MKKTIFFCLLLLSVMCIASSYAASFNDMYAVPEYSVYNSYASENGRQGDLLHITGKLEYYAILGQTKAMVLRDAEGNKWCLPYLSEALDSLQGQTVDVYGVYHGYSNVLQMPSIYILTQGGVLLSDGTFIVDSFAVNPEGMTFEPAGQSALEYHQTQHVSYGVPAGWKTDSKKEFTYFYATKIGSIDGGYITIYETDTSFPAQLSASLLDTLYDSILDGMGEVHSVDTVQISDLDGRIANVTISGYDAQVIVLYVEGYIFAQACVNVSEPLFQSLLSSISYPAVPQEEELNEQTILGSWRYQGLKTGNTTFGNLTNSDYVITFNSNGTLDEMQDGVASSAIWYREKSGEIIVYYPAEKEHYLVSFNEDKQLVLTDETNHIEYYFSRES